MVKEPDDNTLALIIIVLPFLFSISSASSTFVLLAFGKWRTGDSACFHNSG